MPSALGISRGALKTGDQPESAPSTTATTGHRPTALGEALRATGASIGIPKSGSETPSEEDYDQTVRPDLTGASLRRRVGLAAPEKQRPDVERSDSGVLVIPHDDKGVQQFLEKSSQPAAGEPSAAPSQRPEKFRDFVFTHQFSAFDRKNTEATNSPFHGFFTLFWMGVALFVLKISCENWRIYGSPLGTNEIMKTMFHRDGRLPRPESS